MKKHYVLTGLILLAAAPGFAQVKIGAAGAPDPSATLEVTSGAAHNKGLLLPRLTDGERNAMTNPASGLMIFNTSANSVQVNIGTSLLPLWATATATADGWNITGNAGTNPATNFLGTTDNQPLSIRTNNAEAIHVTADGKVGIGIAAPAVKLHVNGGGLTITNNGAIPGSAINIISDNAGTLNPDNISITAYGTSNPIIGISAARGTASAPQNSQAGDNIGQFAFAPRINGAFNGISRITASYVGDGTTEKSRMAFYSSNAAAMVIDSNGNVGVGITAPKVKLQVNGGILLRRDVNIAHGNGSYITWSTVRSGVGETEFINYRGTGSGGFRFYDVNPGGSVDTANYVPGGGASNNYIAFIAPGTGAYSSISDMRVKTNVNIIDGALEKVMAMRPVSYDFHTNRRLKDGVITFAKDDKPMKTIGFLAQELAKIVPEAVVIPKDPANELYTVSYTTVIPVLTKAIQEQQAEIENLKAALAVSKADNIALKADVSKISALAERVLQLEASLNTTAAAHTAVSK
jgi:hypothetical protein